MNQVEIGSFVYSDNEIHHDKTAKLDLQKLIEGRALIQANSGGGKSYLLRKILEATNGLVQQIIIDPEGEYATLREKFDNYILVGKDGDLPINLKSAEVLAERLLELGANAIIDLYELPKHERIKFVRLFLEALVNVDKRLWHDCIIVVDEAHIFAPEKGHGDAESLQAVTDLATRGRKRGFALVAATQRPAKFNKDVSAELNTKFVGRCVQDIDQARAADELGFTKQDRVLLRKLEHEFYCFGGAISEDVKKIKAGKVITNPPKFGQAVKVLTTGKIKDLLSKLSDLDVAADKARMTKQDLELKVKQLELKLKQVSNEPNQKLPPQPEVLQENYNAGYAKGFETAEIYYVNQYVNLENWIKKKVKEMQDLAQQMLFVDLPPKLNNYLPAKIPKALTQARPIQNYEVRKPFTPGEIMEYSKTQNENQAKQQQGEIKILQYCAMFYPKNLSKSNLSILAGYTTSTLKEYLRKLSKLEWVKITGDEIAITTEGMKNAGNYENLPTAPKEILGLWVTKLPPGAAKVLQAVFDDGELSKQTLLELTKFTTSTLKEYLRILAQNELIIIDGDEIKLSQAFFMAQKGVA